MPVERGGRADRGRVARRLPAGHPERAAGRAHHGRDARTTSRRSLAHGGSLRGASDRPLRTARVAVEAASEPRYGPPDASAGAPLHRHPHLRRAARTSREPDGRRRRGRRGPVRHRHELPPGRALRARRRSAPARSRCAHSTRRSTSTCSRALSVVDCGDLDDHARQRRADRGADRRRPRPLLEAGRRPDRARRRPLDRARRAARARGAARPARARAARRARRHLGRSTTASATSTARPSGGRSRRACSTPERSVLAGMRGPLYAAGGPRRRRARWASTLIAGDELRAMAPGGLRARASASASARRRRSSASTST